MTDYLSLVKFHVRYYLMVSLPAFVFFLKRRRKLYIFITRLEQNAYNNSDLLVVNPFFQVSDPNPFSLHNMNTLYYRRVMRKQRIDN